MKTLIAALVLFAVAGCHNNPTDCAASPGVAQGANGQPQAMPWLRCQR